MDKQLSVNRFLPLTKLISHARSPLYRNAYALMLNTVGTASLGLVYWVLAARFYSPEIVGSSAAIISTMTFLAGISHLNLITALVRFIPRAGHRTGRLVRYSYLTSVAVSGTISSLVILLGIQSSVFGYADADQTFNLWFILAAMASCIFLLQDSVMNGLRQSVWVPIENISYALIKIVLLISFATVFPHRGIFASWTLPMFAIILPVNFLIFYRLIPKHVRATREREETVYAGEIVKYVAGNYVGQLFTLAAVRLLPLIVAYRLGPSATAYFYLPWNIVFALKLFSTNMVTSLTVEGANDQAKFAAKGYKFLIHMAKLYVPMIAFLMIGAPFILRLSGGRYAAEGTGLLRLLALSSLPNAISTFYIGTARVQKRTHKIIIVQGLYSALALSLSYFLLPIFHINGIGYAILISETIAALAVVPSILKMRAAQNVKSFYVDPVVPERSQ